jgi:hypothetical protein
MEIFEGNRFYGHGSILKRYAGIPSSIPFPATIQHGLLGSRDLPIEHDLQSPLRTFWVWSRRQAEKFRVAGGENIVIGGAPFVYLVPDEARVPATNRKGTVAFPHHGTHHVDIVSGSEEYAEALQQLPEEFHPVRVCLHHADRAKGLDKPYRERGLEVVCNGGMFESSFLEQFVQNCTGFRFVTSNILATAAYYAMYLGLSFFLHGPRMVMMNRSDPRIPGGIRKTEPGFPELAEAFTMDHLGEHEFQRFFSEVELGRHLKMSPEKLCAWIRERSREDVLVK